MLFARAVAAALALAPLSLLGCSSPTLPLGTPCNSDADCSGDLVCLELASSDADGGCSSEGSSCTKGCQTDADCAELGQTYHCVAGCNGTSSCEQETP
jgi:hypothetical protein